MIPDAPARCEGPPSPVCPPRHHRPWWADDEAWCWHPHSPQHTTAPDADDSVPSPAVAVQGHRRRRVALQGGVDRVADVVHEAREVVRHRVTLHPPRSSDQPRHEDAPGALDGRTGHAPPLAHSRHPGTPRRHRRMSRVGYRAPPAVCAESHHRASRQRSSGPSGCQPSGASARWTRAQWRARARRSRVRRLTATPPPPATPATAAPRRPPRRPRAPDRRGTQPSPPPRRLRSRARYAPSRSRRFPVGTTIAVCPSVSVAVPLAPATIAASVT